MHLIHIAYMEFGLCFTTPNAHKKNVSQQENKDKHNTSNRELIEKIINERQTDRLLLEKIANDLTSLHQKIELLMV